MDFPNYRDSHVMVMMRRFVREWVEKYPSMRKISDAIARQRTLGSQGTVTNYVKAVRKFCAYLAVEDPEVLLQKF
ncbi:MAG TPA: hypothetical protein VEC97_05575 [Candidatus Acidoferrales bacterium]|nr:hypothetical protein [Candidatus Acidoferrales bacterium]